MEFWIIWGIGIVLTLVTAVMIREEDTKIPEWAFLLMVSACIIIVGGIADAKWVAIFFSGDFETEFGVFDIIMGTMSILFPMILTYFVGYCVTGLYLFEKKWQQIYFVILFVVSVIGWTIPIVHYNRNIEVIEQTVAIQTSERQLYYFCNIPVQNISGNLSGRSTLGSGSVRGTISTTDVLPYWYASENGDALYDSANANNSFITFIEDDEKSYVELIKYQNQKTTANHNNGKEDMEVTGEWFQYHFYLPESIMQYTLE